MVALDGSKSMASADKKDKLMVGQRISWHTRPEVHADHGGYLTTNPHTGIVRSVHDEFAMVGTGKILHCWVEPYNPEERLAVEFSNPSIKLLEHD